MHNTGWDRARFIVQNSDGVPFEIETRGSATWALTALKAAGQNGCTPVQVVGSRWDNFVQTLRDLGVRIEEDDGETGTTYRLASDVERTLGVGDVRRR